MVLNLLVLLTPIVTWLSTQYLPQAIHLNLVMCLFAAMYGYKGHTRRALFLAFFNILAFLWHPFLNFQTHYHIALMVMTFLTLMFVGIGLGVRKDKVGL